MKILGVDEAGRGCVIGPMVVGGVMVDEGGLVALTDLGVRDSKRLSPERRKELAAGIRKTALGYELRRVTPRRIDETSLNLLDIEEIVFFARKFSPQKVYFDVPTHPGGVRSFVRMIWECLRDTSEFCSDAAYCTLGAGDAPHFAEASAFAEVSISAKATADKSADRPRGKGVAHLFRVAGQVGQAAMDVGIELVGENHADGKYPVVSAASILAKVERDRIIAELRGEYGDFGSGYPSDPKTQAFLRSWFGRHHDFPPIVRRKWGTVRRLLEGQQGF